MYKYNCRKCPIRNRCVDESKNSTGTKVMVKRAFEARTDTLSTWGLLQKNCLLQKSEESRSTSALSERLQKARTVKEKRDAQTEAQQVTKYETSAPAKKSTLRRIRRPADKSGKKEKPAQHPDYLQPVSPTKAKRPLKPLKRLSSTKKAPQKSLGTFWLTLKSTGRHIALPKTGQLVLGRFDPNIGIPPDVDLVYEDKGSNLISRRHARIMVKDDQHTIEDLGSRSGIFLNGNKIYSGPVYPLNPGDQIRLGSLNFLYDKIPAQILKVAKSQQVRHIFTVTPTGRKLTISSQKEIIIGRADPHINFVPDIDLSHDGDVTRRVSRRHAALRWKNGQPYLEDLGSGFGTRLDGEDLSLGESAPLKPGDHIWLAGCVLAYDIELEGDAKQ